MGEIKVHTERETYTLTTTREVTHAAVAINYKGEENVLLTRSPKSAISNLTSGGYAQRENVRVAEIVNGEARFGTAE